MISVCTPHGSGRLRFEKKTSFIGEASINQTTPTTVRPTMSSSLTAQTPYTAVINDTKTDPYTYLSGFGNRHLSEAIPGVLPDGVNAPQKVKWDLYAEQINGTAFVTPRAENKNAWLYRIRPAVAHQGMSSMNQNPDMESNFAPSNPRVHILPTQMAWLPFDIPSGEEKVDFVDGIKTLAGNGDPTLKEGLAIHVYMANSDMINRAYCNVDGEMLIIPQQGRLDIQTEFGHLMVRPKEIVVIPRGIRFTVKIPDGPVRGYIQEVFGASYELPELGVLGTSCLAMWRDFQFPVASFDLDQSGWELIYKLTGKQYRCTQEHTPYDVVAWHGNYLPYKYDLDKFLYVGAVVKEHIDPSANCVLTVPSKIKGTPLVDFLIFGARWDVGMDTYRLPYFHRNGSSEYMGLICGEWPGRSDDFIPGAGALEASHFPHGIEYGEFKEATEKELKPEWISEGSIAFMFESSMMFTVTDFAAKSSKMHEHSAEMWDPLRAQFIDHLTEVNEHLRRLGLQELRTSGVAALSKAGESLQ